ncbi:hypothetical protein VMCG_01982 [Cytospora schulzeri]|uniref:Uncharacterized protein n=1 Tax=Cytospora schulzeri TaxID=448051 RepID=A0A423X3H8_9PEZI|nr:hypothetical protein VMCG_01982 [Valsa malicola]
MADLYTSQADEAGPSSPRLRDSHVGTSRAFAKWQPPPSASHSELLGTGEYRYALIAGAHISPRRTLCPKPAVP